MELSGEAKTLLGILNFHKGRDSSPTLDTLSADDEWKKVGQDERRLVFELDQLIDGGFILQTGERFSLTQQGAMQAKQIMREGFSSFLVARESSQASRKLCKQVYGIDLCQINMMSRIQLEKLLAVMEIGENDHILDLGCGVGRISEYISDRTGARVTGIDFASAAIQRAQERTHAKRDRLSYRVMDMDALDLPPKRFSGVISIDTLYFVEDLMRTILSLQECLDENGRMGIFYSTSISEDQKKDELPAGNTKLAKILKECELNFQTWDFTQDEGEIWEKILQASEELKQEYEAEGNLEIYESNVSEAKYLIEFSRSGRSSRYLYLVR